MDSGIYRIVKFALCLVVGLWLSPVFPARAQGTPTYYDTFYDDYYKSFPNAKPAAQSMYPAASASVPSAQPARAPSYANASYYNTSIEHNLKEWEIDIRYKTGYGNFMFLTDQESLLTWDDLSTTEIMLNVSRDFMFRNRQYVFAASYGTGSGSTSRTADDDIFHPMHRISLGSGTVDLSNWSLGVGMRNMFMLAGFNATPYVGIRQRQQDFNMGDHVSPSQFYLERFCVNPNPGNAWPTTSDGRLVCANIDIASNAAGWGLTVGTGDLYYIDGNGEVINGTPAWSSGTGDLTIQGVVNYNSQNYYNLLYGDLIADEDFCYYTPGSIANGYSMVCMDRGVNRLNLVAVFGGASLLENDTVGVTHIYNVSWFGPYVGLGLEKAISPLQTFRLYGEIFVPIYKAEGIWPYRSDWKQDPSFIDKGGTSWGFLLDATYKYRIRSNMEVSIGGQYEYLQAGGADTTLYLVDGTTFELPGSILKAKWRNYSLLLGVSFKL